MYINLILVYDYIGGMYLVNHNAGGSCCIKNAVTLQQI